MKGKYKFKASEIAKKRKFSFANIVKVLNENKNGRSQSPPTPRMAIPKPTPPVPKQEPSVVEKVIDAGLSLGENLAEGFGGLFKLGPDYAPPEQEAMNNEMERRRKKAKRKGRSL